MTTVKGENGDALNAYANHIVDWKKQMMKKYGRKLANDLGDGIAGMYVDNINDMKPGSVTDLTSKYKPVKRDRYGWVYPILVGTGKMRNSIKKGRVIKTKNGYIIEIAFGGYHSGSDDTGPRRSKRNVKGKAGKVSIAFPPKRITSANLAYWHHGGVRGTFPGRDGNKHKVNLPSRPFAYFPKSFERTRRRLIIKYVKMAKKAAEKAAQRKVK